MTRFEEQTDDVIRQRMLGGMSPVIDKRQGSVAYDLTAPASAEFAQAYIALDNVLTFGFAGEDMPDEYLDLRTAELGVYRKPSVKSTGQLTFTGQDGTPIPVGTRARTEDDVYFVTTQSGTITGGAVTLNAQAEEGGLSGNVGANAVTTILGDLTGIVTVTNAESFDGGADVESSASLLQRYYDKAQKPVTSGNIYHYEQWAKEVAGVGDARGYAVWNGPGTVKVVLLDEEKTTPAQSVIDAVTTHIEGQRPVGAEVTVVGAQEVAINVSASLTLASGVVLSEVKADIERGVTEYLASLAFKDTLVRYTRIAAILLDIPRIIDYADLTVNLGVENIEVTDEQVAVLGEVTVDAV